MVTCEDCTDRNKLEIERDNVTALHFFLKQLKGIRCYQVDLPSPIGEGFGSYVLSPSEVQYIKDNNIANISSGTGCCDAPFLDVPEVVETRSYEYGANGLIVATVQIKVCYCTEDTETMPFSGSDFSKFNRVKCATC